MTKVSIIIPVYNSMKTIQRTIKSCLDQTYNDIEIIVIDDGSIDDSGQIIKSFDDQRIKYYYFENSGRSNARNKGIELSIGQYIQFLDSDDTLESDKIEKAVKILEADRNLAAVHCGTTYWKGEEIIKRIGAVPRKIDEVLLRQNLFPINSIVLRKEKASLFPVNLSYCEDWLFWVHSLIGEHVYFQEEYFGSNVFIHGHNTMSNHGMMLLGEIIVLTKIKEEINLNSVKRDFKLIKSFVQYRTFYGDLNFESFKTKRNTVFSILTFLNYLFKKKVIKGIFNSLYHLKGRVKKQDTLY